jgi:hypothetical protein
MTNAHRGRIICPYCWKQMDNANALKAHINSRKHAAVRKMMRSADEKARGQLQKYHQDRMVETKR